GSDEIRDRGDAVCLADPDHLQHHVPPQRRHQRRAEVNRQEPDAARRGAGDAAVERPRSAIDGEGQRGDIGSGEGAEARIGARVTVIGDREQQPNVGERSDDDGGRGEHQSPRRSRMSAINAMSSAHTANTYAYSKGMPSTSADRSNKWSTG